MCLKILADLGFWITRRLLDDPRLNPLAKITGRVSFRMEIRFHSKSRDYGWLSNFAGHANFTLGGEKWLSVEHYYQAHKFLDAKLRKQIQSADSPLKAKKMASSRNLAPRSDWDSVKEAVMSEGVRAKFKQHRKLRRLLLATGDAKLIHESSSDEFWGRGKEGAGFNRLGEILEEIREELRREGNSDG